MVYNELIITSVDQSPRILLYILAYHSASSQQLWLLNFLYSLTIVSWIFILVLYLLLIYGGEVHVY